MGARLVVLVGPKGSGKTTIGRMLEDRLEGASAETSAFLAELRRRYDVRLARIHARRETCAARIAARDPPRQIQVASELVRAMHERSMSLAPPWGLEVDNDPAQSADGIVRAFAPLLRRGAVGKERLTPLVTFELFANSQRNFMTRRAAIRAAIHRPRAVSMPASMSFNPLRGILGRSGLATVKYLEVAFSDDRLAPTSNGDRC